LKRKTLEVEVVMKWDWSMVGIQRGTKLKMKLESGLRVVLEAKDLDW
jgi:hypothetical protein